MKPYSQILIQDAGEALVPIPLEKFAIEFPHPYEKLGANYRGKSPYYLRQSVLERLIVAQRELQHSLREWQIKIFDAYRPVEVQQFMVDYTFASVLRTRELNSKELSPQQCQSIWEEVYQIWALPSFEESTPPPHSTGAAIDVTLVDSSGSNVDMGGEIDELRARSHPDYYANSSNKEEREYHARRELLHKVMKKGGFCRHPGEWWHFSFGDQMWAWQYNLENPSQVISARYGRV